MSSLIKAAAAGSAAIVTIRPGAAGRTPAMIEIVEEEPQPAAAAAEALDALRRECARLQLSLEERDAEIARLEKAAKTAFAAGEKAGVAAAGTREEERLRALDAAVAQAGERLAATLSDADRLAAMLARSALDRLFGDAAARAETVEALIRRQLAGMEADAVLHVEIAAADFPDASAIEKLAAGLDRPAADIRRSDKLASGDCRMKLRLGGIELGIAQQWGALRALLDGYAGAEAAR